MATLWSRYPSLTSSPLLNGRVSGKYKIDSTWAWCLEAFRDDQSWSKYSCERNTESQLAYNLSVREKRIKSSRNCQQHHSQNFTSGGIQKANAEKHFIPSEARPSGPLSRKLQKFEKGEDFLWDRNWLWDLRSQLRSGIKRSLQGLVPRRRSEHARISQLGQFRHSSLWDKDEILMIDYLKRKEMQDSRIRPMMQASEAHMISTSAIINICSSARQLHRGMQRECYSKQLQPLFGLFNSF